MSAAACSAPSARLTPRRRRRFPRFSPQLAARRWLALWLALCGCADRAPPLPSVLRLSPDRLSPGASAALLIEGTGFVPSARADFGDFSRSSVDASFTARLGDLELAEVTWLGTGMLSAQLAAAPVLAGSYDLVVRVPSGAEAALPGAMRVEDPDVEGVGPAALAFVTGGHEVVAGECSAPLSVQARDDAGMPVPVALPLALELSALPSDGAAAFADPSCQTPVDSVLIAAGASDATFYVRGERAGEVEWSVSGERLAPVAQVERIVPGSAARLVFDPVSPAQTAGAPFTVALHAEDAFGNQVLAGVPPASLTLAPAGAVVCVTGCDPASPSTAAFTQGGWTGALRIDGIASGVAIAAADATATLTGRSNPFSVLDPALRTPPLARLLRSPAVVRVGEQVSFDASGSTDAEDSASALSFSWDLDGTQGSPPPWNGWSGTPTATRSYSSAGLHQVRVAVRDTAGDVGAATVEVLVLDPAADLCVVTVSSSVDDGATSCADPALSFPEAIRLSNALAGKQTITFSPGLSVTAGQRFDVSADVDIAVPAGSALTGATFDFLAGTTRIIGLTLTASGGAALGTVEAGASLELSAVQVHGYDVLASYGDLTVRGSSFDHIGSAALSVELAAQRARIVDSLFAGDGAGNGINIHDCQADAISRDLIGNVFLKLAKGVDVKNNCGSGPTRIVNNTFDQLLVGVDYGSTAGGGHVLVNNVFAHASTAGIRCNGVSFAQRDHQLFFANGSDGCGSDPATLTADPLFVGPASLDYRLRLPSPARDTGQDLGQDLTPALPGGYLGAAPDRGGRESW